MPPIIHCVRHAQGYHNLTPLNHSMPDPKLTPHGEAQCAHLSKTFPHHTSTTLLISSPLRRTLSTTLLSFGPILSRPGTPAIIALPEAQETADVPCDTGSAPDVLKAEMAGKLVDLSRVKEGWNSKEGRWAAVPEAIEKRAREVRRWVREREEGEVVLVTHGGFLHYFTQDWGDYDETMGTGWANVETRSYQFTDENDYNATIVETRQSRELRRALPLATADPRGFPVSAAKKWEEDGFEPIQAKV